MYKEVKGKLSSAAGRLQLQAGSASENNMEHLKKRNIFKQGLNPDSYNYWLFGTCGLNMIT